MGENVEILPFNLKKVDAEERRLRSRMLAHYPGSLDGIRLERLASVLCVDEATLQISGIEPQPAGLPTRCVPVALTGKGDFSGFRCVLGLSEETALSIVDKILGRSGRPDGVEPLWGERLLSGEKGALLFALDVAAGDWIGTGGCSFFLKGLLFDGEQVPDFLTGQPDWEIRGRIKGLGDERIWLWFRDPFPLGQKPASVQIGRSAVLWRPVVSLVVGFSVLTVGEVKELELGDKVVLDGWNHPLGTGGEPAPVFVSGGWKRDCRWLDNRKLQVISTKGSAREMETSDEQESMSALLEPSEGDDSGEMAVTVSVEVGSFRISVRQAASLVPGRILSLDQSVGPEVTLKVQGKIIGRGVLVDEEGVMAVEVKEVLV